MDINLRLRKKILPIKTVQWWHFKMSLFHRTIILGGYKILDLSLNSKLSSNLFLSILLYCGVWNI